MSTIIQIPLLSKKRTNIESFTIMYPFLQDKIYFGRLAYIYTNCPSNVFQLIKDKIKL